MGYKKRRNYNSYKNAEEKKPEGKASSFELLKQDIADLERREKYRKEKNFERKPRAVRRFERYSSMGKSDDQDQD